MTYETKSFQIPTLEGISEKTITEHLGLYAGYVKHVNLIHSKIAELSNDMDTHGYAIGEMQRRLGFEFGGMRNHEYYFAQFEGGQAPLAEGVLKSKIESQYGSTDALINRMKQIAMTRGIGWAMLYHDIKTGNLLLSWVDEQHIGQLADLNIVIALDMWEHSYMLDYAPSEKKKYVESFFANLNWNIISNRLT